MDRVKKWSPGVEVDTADYILRRLEADVFPAFGNKPINEVKASDIRNLIISIEQGKGEGRRFKGKDARDVAQRQHGTINQIFRYAIAHELADSNPSAAFKPSEVLQARKTQHRARVETNQLPKADLWSGTNDDIITKLAKLPLEAQPGTQFRYGLQQEVQGQFSVALLGNSSTHILLGSKSQ